MPNALKVVGVGADPLASDVSQLANLFNALLDAGKLQIATAQNTPAASTVADAATVGNLNGAYMWKVVLVTGWKQSDNSYYVSGFAPSQDSASLSLTNSQANLSNIATGTSVVIGRAIYRTAAGGASGSEKFAVIIWDNGTTTWTDNVSDANLGTGMPSSSSSPAAYGTAIPANVPTSNTTGTTLSGDIDAKTLSGLQQTDIVMGKVSPNLIKNAGFEFVSSTAQVFADPLTSYTGTYTSGQTFGPWTVQSGSVTGGASGVTSGAAYSQMTAGNAQWEPVVGSDGSTQLALASQASFTMPSTVPTSVALTLKLWKDSQNQYYAYSDGSTFHLAKDDAGTAGLITSAAQILTASTTYTATLSLDDTGALTAKLYQGTSTAGTLLQTLTATDTSLTGGFLIGIGGDTGVVMSSASVTAPMADSWTIGGDQRVAWALSQNAISGKYSVSGEGYVGTSGGWAIQTPSLSASTAYTVSGYMSTTGVGTGGARINLNMLGVGIATTKLTGTNATDRYSVSGTSGTSGNNSIVISISDSGTVTFDDIQLEQGSTATPYIPPVQSVQTPLHLPSGTSVNEGFKLGTRYQLPDYDYTASALGQKDVYTVLTFYRPDGSTYMVSTLSNLDANNNYQTDTWQFYDTSGNVTETHVWTLTYDSNSVLYKAVRTS